MLYQRPPLYKKQFTAFYCPQRYSLTESSTKAGKTHGAIVWLFEQALFAQKKNQNYWWVAPTISQAKIAFKRMVASLDKDTIEVNLTDREIVLKANRAVLSFKSGEISDNLYGEDVYAAIIDEASRCREETFHAVRSTLTATKGKLRAIGNVKGRKNWFYNLCRRAQSGQADMFYSKITAYDAVAGGVLDLKEIEDAKSMLPEMVFRELYLAEPSDDGGNPFGIQNINAAFRPSQPKGVSEVFGADLAKSFDWTVLTGIDSKGVQSDCDRWQGDLSATTSRIAAKVGKRKCAIDSTGMGIMPAEVLQKQGDNFVPCSFTANFKQGILESLAVALQRGELIITDETTHDELIEFEYEFTRTGVRYSAPAGLHDDCVIALALANYARGQRRPEWGFITI